MILIQVQRSHSVAHFYSSFYPLSMPNHCPLLSFFPSLSPSLSWAKSPWLGRSTGPAICQQNDTAEVKSHLPRWVRSSTSKRMDGWNRTDVLGTWWYSCLLTCKGLGPQTEKNPVSPLKTRSAVLGVGFLGSEWAFKQTPKPPVNLKLSATSNLVSRWAKLGTISSHITQWQKSQEGTRRKKFSEATSESLDSPPAKFITHFPPSYLSLEVGHHLWMLLRSKTLKRKQMGSLRESPDVAGETTSTDVLLAKASG